MYTLVNRLTIGTNGSSRREKGKDKIAQVSDRLLKKNIDDRIPSLMGKYFFDCLIKVKATKTSQMTQRSILN